MVSQWIPLHHLSPEDFKSLVATFVSAFPHSTMWYTKWDAIMIGSDRKLSIDFAKLKQRMEDEAIQRDLREIGFQNPYRLLSTFMMGEEGLRRYTKGAGIVTDNRPTVEFTAPRIHHAGVKIKGKNLRALLRYRETVMPLIKNTEEKRFEEKLSQFNTSQLQFYEGRLYENDGNLIQAVEKFKGSLKREPSFRNARFAFLKIHMALAYHFLAEGKATAGLRIVKECLETDTEGAFRPQLLNLRGLFHLSKKEFHLAARDFLGAVELDKGFPGPYMNLGALYGQYLNDRKKAVNYFKQCLELKVTEEERKIVEEEIRKLENEE
jgi:tetratricopeptide (TPR) repeat protein